MSKKLTVMLLVGIIVLSVTACGNNADPERTDIASTGNQIPSAYLDSVFVGDSLIEGVSLLLDDTYVISNAGATAQFAMEEVDTLVSKKPQNIWIMLGSNDLLWPVDDPTENSMLHYTKLIEEIKEKLPDAAIHVLSVTPMTEVAIEQEPRYMQIPDYNKELEAMAAEAKVDYIDLAPIFLTHPDLHAEDGVHFKPEFYSLLLEMIEPHNGQN